MGNSVRCCLACVLPCGTLDVVRVVHLGGRVEEFSRRVTAGEVLRGNPGHVLSNPCSQGVLRRTLISSPRSELRRGSIYFLIPEASLQQERRSKAMRRTNRRKASKKAAGASEALPAAIPLERKTNAAGGGGVSPAEKEPAVAGEGLSTVAHEERKPAYRRHLWRPRLESVSEEA
ncbi:unnamed protein product [Spirodela intermedia]|uniref:Uncharacterized protein n=1 Tax=Spirodela intermedia TaxID=51605 RepID=A0A7I8LAF6_SPIIN|nr:unnamed protein product [Spirodela intermedia]